MQAALCIVVVSGPRRRFEMGLLVLKISEVSSDQVAERSKALDSGSSPKGRGFEPHPDHQVSYFWVVVVVVVLYFVFSLFIH
jgi:hypothetical protein